MLRVAVDELLREHGVGCSAVGADLADGNSKNHVHYWPAYEMIKEAIAEPYLDDGRHVKPDVVQQVLALFGKYYCRDVENSAVGGHNINADLATQEASPLAGTPHLG